MGVGWRKAESVTRVGILNPLSIIAELRASVLGRSAGTFHVDVYAIRGHLGLVPTLMGNVVALGLQAQP